MVCVCRPDGGIIDECINCILSNIYFPDLEVINAVVDCLSLLSQNIARLSYIDSSSVRQIVEKITGAISEHLNEGTIEIRTCIITRLLFCLQEFIMSCPSVIKEEKLCSMIMESIDAVLALSESMQDGVSIFSHPTSDGRSLPRDLQSDLASSFARSERKPSVSISVADQSRSGNEVASKDGIDQSAQIIKEAAESVLLHVLHNAGNFPTPFGSAILSRCVESTARVCKAALNPNYRRSSIVEPGLLDENFRGDDRTLFFTFNDVALITVLEIPGNSPSTTKTRVIVRNMTGKYAYDSYVFYESLEKMLGLLKKNSRSILDTDITNPQSIGVLNTFGSQPFGNRPALSVVRQKETPQAVYSREVNEIPLHSTNPAAEHHDMLYETLK